MKYTVFIDESGSFQKLKKNNRNITNFVAGWVTEDKFAGRIEDQLENAVKPLSDKIIEKIGDEFTVKIPGSLHFMPLHLSELRKGNDKNIKVPFSNVPELMERIFSSLEKNICFTFRSSGFPNYYINEQASYVEILRSTVLQIIDELSPGVNDSVRFVIAARRVKALIGEYGYENIPDYEKTFCKNLVKEISEVYKIKEIEKIVSVQISDTRKETGLSVADLFCGAFRWTTKDYLENYKKNGKVKLINIHNAFIYISNRTVPRILHLFEENQASGMIKGFEHLVYNTLNDELTGAVKKMISHVSPDELSAFATELRFYLEEKAVEDPDRYNNLDFIENFIGQVDKYIKNPLVNAILKRYRIIILNHRGNTDIKDIEDYLEMLDKEGAELLGSMYLVAQERIEIILSMVQSVAFNKFRFEKVEEYITDEIKSYKTLFPGQPDLVDETLARLEGTIGQMYAFLCDYPDNELFFDYAEQYLLDDLKHCVKGSYFQKQAMGYITSLYFKKRDFEKTLEAFLKETDSRGSNIEKVFDLSLLSAFKSDNGGFFLLHRLYICALAALKGEKIKGTSELANLLINSDNTAFYPVFLSAKWLGVISLLNDDYNTALKLFEKALSCENSEFVVDVIKLPIKILLNLCRKHNDKRLKYDIESELANLEKISSGITENLNRLGVDNYFNYNDSWNAFEIASFMPFYYS